MQQRDQKFVMMSNVAADSAVFDFPGGNWAFMATATWGGGNIALNVLGPDGTTYIAWPSGSLSANGVLTLRLPPGKYKMVRTTATAIYCDALWIPE